MVLYGYVGDVNGWLDVLGLAKRSPVNEFDLAGYDKLKMGIVGDGISSHELLQSAWLNHNHNVSRTDIIGKENPSIGLREKDIHSKISKLQRKYGMFERKNLLNQSALQNINRNTALTRRGIYEGLLERGWEPANAKRYATELSMKLRENAINFAKQNGYIKTHTH